MRRLLERMGLVRERREVPVTLVVESIARLRLKPGEILIIRTSGTLSPQAAQAMGEALSSVVPDGVKMWMIDRSVDVSVFEIPKVAA